MQISELLDKIKTLTGTRLFNDFVEENYDLNNLVKCYTDYEIESGDLVVIDGLYYIVTKSTLKTFTVAYYDGDEDKIIEKRLNRSGLNEDIKSVHFNSSFSANNQKDITDTVIPVFKKVEYVDPYENLNIGDKVFFKGNCLHTGGTSTSSEIYAPKFTGYIKSIDKSKYYSIYIYQDNLKGYRGYCRVEEIVKL